MTPMIDMVFLLLVFFMTVSTLAQAGKQVELDLPESVESTVPKDLSGRGVLSIDADGIVYHATVPHDIASLKALIRSSLSETPGLRVQIRADRNTRYERIKSVLRACAEAGASEIIYATHEEY